MAGSTRAWRKLRAQVIAEEPTCRIQTPGICTSISTEADHIAPKSIRPDLAMSRANLRGACLPCNRSRGNGTNKPHTPTGRPNITIITGPPAAGKTTWVRNNAQPGDITIDYDTIGWALTPPSPNPHNHPQHATPIIKAARQAAIDTALRLTTTCNIYIIHSTPSPTQLNRYLQAGAHIITIDPGQATVTARCKAERPWRLQRAVTEWYDTHQHHIAAITNNQQHNPEPLDFFAC